MYGSRAGAAIENSTGELDIFPGRAFPRRIAQQSRGVISDDERYAVVFVDKTTELADRSFGVQESLGSEGPKSNNDFRLDQLELSDQIRAASFDFFGPRVSVSGRAMFEDVANEDLLTG